LNVAVLGVQFVPYIQTMSELEAVATRKKKAAKAASKKKRVAKIVGGVALGAAAVAVAGLAKRRETVFDEEIIPDWIRDMDRSYIPLAEAATRGAMQAIVDDSLTPEEVAALLDISPAAIYRRIQKRTLYAFEHEQGWLLPKFQFRGNRTVRHVEKIVPRLEHEFHPIEVVNWFTYPHVDLYVGDESVSPVEWLEAGGDVKFLKELAEDAGSGL
jgi:hypothetical protein